MNHTQTPPTCPQCGARVYRTHTCRVSGLRLGLNGKLPEPGEVLPAARPLTLVPMPEGWRDQVSAECATWPARAQLHLVEEEDLDEAGDWRLDQGSARLGTVLTTLALALGTAACVLVDRLPL